MVSEKTMETTVMTEPAMTDSTPRAPSGPPDQTKAMFRIHAGADGSVDRHQA